MTERPADQTQPPQGQWSPSDHCHTAAEAHQRHGTASCSIRTTSGNFSPTVLTICRNWPTAISNSLHGTPDHSHVVATVVAESALSVRNNGTIP